MMYRSAWMFLVATCGLLVAAATSTPLSAADHSAEVIEEAPPAEVSPAIAKLLEKKAVRVTRGSSRKLCDIWVAKQWDVPSFEAGADLLYPFRSGQLIGVVRFHRDSNDFRDQEFEEGVYTLRYAQQPVDGAHVGTSLTRDFLLLLPAKADKDPEAMLYRPLTEASDDVVGTTHPALLAMKKLKGEGPIGSMRENEEEDWWLVRLGSQAKVDDQVKELLFDLVVVGIFNE